jgi:hypothetical protein
LGPSAEAEAEFEKELAKLVTDTTGEGRRVDKKTALQMWDSAVLPPAVRNKKRGDDAEDEGNEDDNNNSVMNFTIVTKRGNKHQVCIVSAVSTMVFIFRLDAATSCPCGICIGYQYAQRTAEGQG